MYVFFMRSHLIVGVNIFYDSQTRRCPKKKKQKTELKAGTGNASTATELQNWEDIWHRNILYIYIVCEVNKSIDASSILICAHD